MGKVLCEAGHLHKAKTSVPEGCIAVGILGKVDYKGQGMILALQDAPQQALNTINGWLSLTTYAGTTVKQLPDDAARGSLKSYTKLGTTPVSNWVVAQKDDYVAIFKNLGSTTDILGDGVAFDRQVGAYLTTGVGGKGAIGDYKPYWSVSPARNGTWYFTSMYWNYLNKPAEVKNVRPLMVFGGTESTTSYPLEEEVVKVGMIVGSDGRAYTADSKDYMPNGITAAGMLAYKNGGTRLIIALTDEASPKNWNDAQTAEQL